MRVRVLLKGGGPGEAPAGPQDRRSRLRRDCSLREQGFALPPAPPAPPNPTHGDDFMLGTWGMFFLKMFILLAGVYVIVILTPKLAAFIDKRRKNSEEEPRPERVQDSENTENSAEEGDNNQYKSE